MPIPFTEMIWDQDLRPQGGAVALRFTSDELLRAGFALHGIYATGSHVFEDESVMFGRRPARPPPLGGRPGLEPAARRAPTSSSRT